MLNERKFSKEQESLEHIQIKYSVYKRWVGAVNVSGEGVPNVRGAVNVRGRGNQCKGEEQPCWGRSNQRRGRSNQRRRRSNQRSREEQPNEMGEEQPMKGERLSCHDSYSELSAWQNLDYPRKWDSTHPCGCLGYHSWGSDVGRPTCLGWDHSLHSVKMQEETQGLFPLWVRCVHVLHGPVALDFLTRCTLNLEPLSCSCQDVITATDKNFKCVCSNHFRGRLWGQDEQMCSDVYRDETLFSYVLSCAINERMAECCVKLNRPDTERQLLQLLMHRWKLFKSVGSIILITWAWETVREKRRVEIDLHTLCAWVEQQ